MYREPLLETTKSHFDLTEYEDQLKTSAWLQKKYEILSRDNFRCTVCLCDNYERQIEVHHVCYRKGKMAWEYEDFLLVTLCRDCHQKEHDNNNIYKKNKIIEWITKLVSPQQKPKPNF